MNHIRNRKECLVVHIFPFISEKNMKLVEYLVKEQLYSLALKKLQK